MERASIHPSREEWTGFVNKTLLPDIEARLMAHLKECEFCAEAIRRYKESNLFQNDIDSGDFADRSKVAAQAIYRQVFGGKVFQLDSCDPIYPTEYQLAADSKRKSRPHVENLATVFNGEPEIVLKVMRDNRINRTYLHLASDNEAFFAHVLVEETLTNRTYVTNERGMADIGDADSFDVMSAKWQVKLPEAEFTLEPLTFDPDRTEYQRETTLDSGRGDRIRVTFEGKELEKRVKLEVLSLDGLNRNVHLIAAVSVNQTTTTYPTGQDRPFYLNLEKLPASIHIRLFS